MKLNRKFWQFFGSVLCLGISVKVGFATQLHMKVNLSGWYQTIYFHELTAEKLEVKKGDTMTIKTPGSSYITSGWGAITLEHCRILAYKGSNTSLTSCLVQSVYPWRQGVTLGIQGVNEKMSGQGEISIVSN